MHVTIEYVFVNSIFNDEFILDIRYARLIFIFFQETSSIKLSEKKVFSIYNY